MSGGTKVNINYWFPGSARAIVWWVLHRMSDLYWNMVFRFRPTIVVDGRLTLQGALDALPPQGGTVVGANETVSRPIVIPRKEVRIIGCHLRSFGVDFMDTGLAKRVWIIGCFFEGVTVGPKDWSPRAEMHPGRSPALVLFADRKRS